jgi:hypothetical protein
MIFGVRPSMAETPPIRVLQHRKFRLVAVGLAIDVPDHLGHSRMIAKDRSHGIGYLADGGAGPRGIHSRGKQVALAALGHLGQMVERSRDCSAVAAALGSRARRVICALRTALLSISRMSIGSSLSSLYLLTPTMTSSPLSTAACRRVAASSISRFGSPR